jgi:hypothetical protein
MTQRPFFTRAVPAALVASIAFGAGVPSATATTLRSGGATGMPLATGTTAGAPLAGNAVVTTPFGPVTCSDGSFGGMVGANPAALVPLATPEFRFGSIATPCVGPPSGPFRIFDYELISGGSFTVAANAPSTGGVLRGEALRIRMRVASPRTLSAPNGSCDLFINNSSAVVINSDASVRFTNQPITAATGLCALLVDANSGISATFAPLAADRGSVAVTQ